MKTPVKDKQEEKYKVKAAQGLDRNGPHFYPRVRNTKPGQESEEVIAYLGGDSGQFLSFWQQPLFLRIKLLSTQKKGSKRIDEEWISLDQAGK